MGRDPGESSTWGSRSLSLLWLPSRTHQWVLSHLLRLCFMVAPYAFPQFWGLIFLPWPTGSHEAAPKQSSSKSPVSSKLWSPTCSQFLFPRTQPILLYFSYPWILWVSASLSDPLSAPNSHGFLRMWASLGEPGRSTGRTPGCGNSRVWGTHSHWLTWECCARVLVLLGPGPGVKGACSTILFLPPLTLGPKAVAGWELGSRPWGLLETLLKSGCCIYFFILAAGRGSPSQLGIVV